jgi:hypothetical protein
MGVRALDLASYYIDPRMAGCQILVAAWMPKVRSLSSGMRIGSSRSCRGSGLVGQEMTIADYLNYIRAEALAYERRSSTRSGGEGPASTLALVAGRVPASASSLLICLYLGTSGGRVFVFTRGKQAYQQTSRSSLIRETAICTLFSSFTAYFSLVQSQRFR